VNRVATSEGALDAFFSSFPHRGDLTVIPNSRPACDGQGRRLWRVVLTTPREA
jgi:hypothetical protein